MARKKKQPESSPGAPLYMATYGDMVTLLLCFFVLLYSFSTLDTKKFESLAASMQAAFSVTQGGGSTAPIPGTDNSAGSKQQASAKNKNSSTSAETAITSQKLLAMMEQIIKSEKLEDEVHVAINERGVVITFSEKLLFAPGSAKIHPEALRILYKVSKILNDLPNRLSIEGHTDSEKPTGSVYNDNWGLSSARAAAVASYLDNSIGLKSDRLSAVGYSSNAPLVPNDTPEHMKLNRRVDVVILSLHSVR